MKHQYDALSSVEQGEAVELDCPASPDTLVNNADQTTEATTTNTTNTAIPLATPIPAPNSIASVNEVRHYIVRILHESFHVPREEAEIAASRWHGLGHRLHKIKIEELGEMLGDRYASMIQQYIVAVAAYNESINAQALAQGKRVHAAWLSIMVFCFFTLLFLRLADK